MDRFRALLRQLVVEACTAGGIGMPLDLDLLDPRVIVDDGGNLVEQVEGLLLDVGLGQRKEDLLADLDALDGHDHAFDRAAVIVGGTGFGRALIDVIEDAVAVGVGRAAIIFGHAGHVGAFVDGIIDVVAVAVGGAAVIFGHACDVGAFVVDIVDAVAVAVGGAAVIFGDACDVGTFVVGVVDAVAIAVGRAAVIFGHACDVGAFVVGVVDAVAIAVGGAAVIFGHACDVGTFVLIVGDAVAIAIRFDMRRVGAKTKTERQVRAALVQLILVGRLLVAAER